MRASNKHRKWLTGRVEQNRIRMNRDTGGIVDEIVEVYYDEGFFRWWPVPMTVLGVSSLQVPAIGLDRPDRIAIL